MKPFAFFTVLIFELVRKEWLRPLSMNQGNDTKPLVIIVVFTATHSWRKEKNPVSLKNPFD